MPRSSSLGRISAASESGYSPYRGLRKPVSLHYIPLISEKSIPSACTVPVAYRLAPVIDVMLV